MIDRVSQRTIQAARVPAERIAVYGEFGGGNFGNDASLDALLRILGGWGYDISKILCFCRGPEVVSDTFGMRALHIGGRNPSRRLGPFKWMLSWLEKARDLVRMCVLAGDFSIVVVPGTGIVEDGVSTWGVPFDLFCLAMACTLRRTRLLVLCVGAGLPRNWLTRLFYRHFLRAASFRSYRDKYSMGAATALGVETAGDHVYADLAMGLPVPQPRWPTSSPSVALGLVTHAGGESRDARARSKHAAYVRSLVELVARLVSTQHPVLLLIGDEGDQHVVDEVLAGLTTARSADLVATARARSFTDVVDELNGCDVLIASRYHNLIAGALSGRPTIALGYGPKHAALQESLGLGEFSHRLESVNQDGLILEIESLRKNSAHWRRKLNDGVARARVMLEVQEVELRGIFGVGMPPAVAGDD